MLKTRGQPNFFKGSMPSVSPTALAAGVFSLCSGGVPSRGGFSRLPGKTIRNSGVSSGGVISIHQLGELVIIQKFTGVEIFDLRELVPDVQDYVYTNEGILVKDNEGIPVTV